MAAIRSLQSVREKWATVTPQRTAQYQSGVENPKADWAANAKAAASSFEQGVQAAVANKSFEKGVQAAGTTKWQDNAVSKGVSRWAPGVQQAAPDYESGFAPFHDVIAKTNLPPRFPRGDVRNYQRTQAIGEALHRKKLQG